MKISKTFRLSEDAVAILESKQNASRFIEDLILKGGEGISRGEAMILDKLNDLSSNGRTEAFEASNLGSSPSESAIPYGSAITLPYTAVKNVIKDIPVMPACCLGKSPCKHWAYDGLKEAYVNSISGEIKNI